MINAHESGSNSLGVGTFSRDLTKQSPCGAGILPGLCIWKKSILSPLFPGLGRMWLQMTGALSADFFFKIIFFKNSFRNTISKSYGLDLDQDPAF